MGTWDYKERQELARRWAAARVRVLAAPAAVGFCVAVGLRLHIYMA